MHKLLFTLVFVALSATITMAMELTKNIDDVFYKTEVKGAPNAKPILVKDTDSALGRYNLHAKKLDIITLARAHGHLCDGLLISYVELSHTLPKLFNDGIVDRTDLRVVAKNSPCLVDTSALMSGARINHKTLSLDNSLGSSFIVQRISTGETLKVSLAQTDFLKALKDEEKRVKTKISQKKEVTSQDIDSLESLAFKAMQYLLHSDTKKLLKIEKLLEYTFEFSTKDFGSRSDIVNKNILR